MDAALAQQDRLNDLAFLGDLLKRGLVGNPDLDTSLGGVWNRLAVNVLGFLCHFGLSCNPPYGVDELEHSLNKKFNSRQKDGVLLNPQFKVQSPP